MRRHQNSDEGELYEQECALFDFQSIDKPLQVKPTHKAHSSVLYDPKNNYNTSHLSQQCEALIDPKGSGKMRQARHGRQHQFRENRHRGRSNNRQRRQYERGRNNRAEEQKARQDRQLEDYFSYVPTDNIMPKSVSYSMVSKESNRHDSIQVNQGSQPQRHRKPQQKGSEQDQSYKRNPKKKQVIDVDADESSGKSEKQDSKMENENSSVWVIENSRILDALDEDESGRMEDEDAEYSFISDIAPEDPRQRIRQTQKEQHQNVQEKKIISEESIKEMLEKVEKSLQDSWIKLWVEFTDHHNVKEIIIKEVYLPRIGCDFSLSLTPNGIFVKKSPIPIQRLRDYVEFDQINYVFSQKGQPAEWPVAHIRASRAGKTQESLNFIKSRRQKDNDSGEKELQVQIIKIRCAHCDKQNSIRMNVLGSVLALSCRKCSEPMAVTLKRLFLRQ